MTDIQLRFKALECAHSGMNCTQMEAVIEIYNWLKEAEQPAPSPEVKAALAQAADEIDPPTPEESHAARRAYEAVPLLERTVWVKKLNGSIWVETIKSYHVAPDADRCYMTSTGAILWGKDLGITWSLTEDGFQGAAEAPAELAKRVPQIKDTITHKGFNYLVFHINDRGEFWAVVLGPFVNDIVRLTFDQEGKEGGWSFKD